MTGEVIVSETCVKLATTFFEPFTIKEAGFEEPNKSPAQFEKPYPGNGVAETETLWPLSYQLSPEGFTVPAPGGFTDAVKLYWVVKFAV